MKLAVVIIGDEILLGRVTDTNSGLIARTFTAAGWDVESVQTVGDDAGAIAAAVRRALGAADLVITTGGLGPTRDDITKGVLTEIFGGTLRRHDAVLANVERVFAERGIAMNDLTRAQAMVPTSCTVIQNRLGTAPIMWFHGEAGTLVAMPGVPFETRGMLSEVLDAAQRHFHASGHFRRCEFTVTGISESALAERLAGYEDSLPAGTHLAYLPSAGRIVLRLDARDITAGAFAALTDSLKSALGSLLAGEGALSPAEILLNRLRARGLTLATAESCTGGNIGHLVTAVAGSSDVYLGGVISYANSVKTGVLGVSQDDLDRHGAVSEPVVRQMAEGVRRLAGADCAVATSGIAGPGGATPGKPVGTVWIAASGPKGTVAHLLHLPGDRAAVIDAASARAVNLLIESLEF